MEGEREGGREGGRGSGSGYKSLTRVIILVVLKYHVPTESVTEPHWSYYVHVHINVL